MSHLAFNSLYSQQLLMDLPLLKKKVSSGGTRNMCPIFLATYGSMWDLSFLIRSNPWPLHWDVES